jgi:hypothetical protein
MSIARCAVHKMFDLNERRKKTCATVGILSIEVLASTQLESTHAMSLLDLILDF